MELKSKFIDFCKKLDCDINYIDRELDKIESPVKTAPFYNAIEFCMLKGYSFAESLNMVISTNYDYEMLKLMLDTIQRTEPLKSIDWDLFLSKFPRGKRLWKRALNEIEYYYYCIKDILLKTNKWN